MTDTAAIPRIARRQPRRFWSHAMLFTACVLLVNGLFGERGLTETIRARRIYDASVRELTRLKRQNASLRDVARQLRTDPATIEAVARRQLGLVRQDEILIMIHDTR